MIDHDQLAHWLIQQCETQNLSWSEASRRAGLSENTISQAVSGVAVGPKRLTALAEFFHVAPEFLFRLAGLLPPQSNTDDLAPEAYFRLQEFVNRLSHRPPNVQERIMHTALMLLEINDPGEDDEDSPPATDVLSERPAPDTGDD